MTIENETRTNAGMCEGNNTQCKDTKNIDNGSMFSLHQMRQMPLDGLPAWTRQVIEEYAAALVAPVDFVAAGVLVAAATAAGKRCVLKTGSYTNHPNLWVVLVAASGNNKSAPVKFALEPLANIDRTNYLHYREELAGLDEDADPDSVHWSQIIIGDITPEARNQALTHNPNRLLSHCDELQQMVDNFQRYNKGGEVPQMLSIWSNEGYNVNRKKDAPLCITDPYLNIIGGIQPSVLPGTFGKPLFMGNGWNHRFLFAFPELGSIPKTKPREINPRVRNTWRNMVEMLVQSYDEREEHCTLSDAAQRVYDDYCDFIIDEINATNDDYRRGMLSKFKIHILRLAATVQVMHGGGEIAGETMEYCKRLCDYFIECATLVQHQIVEVQHPQGIGNEELLRMLFDRYNVTSQSALADIIGISQQQISKALKKN